MRSEGLMDAFRRRLLPRPGERSSIDGEKSVRHRDQVLRLLEKQIGNAAEVKSIDETAEKVASKWVSPLSGGKDTTNGLIYGLVQSGKTGVLTVTGAVGADE